MILLIFSCLALITYDMLLRDGTSLSVPSFGFISSCFECSGPSSRGGFDLAVALTKCCGWYGVDPSPCLFLDYHRLLVLQANAICVLYFYGLRVLVHETKRT